MKKITLINNIKQLGFSDYETKCYLALCERNSMSVSETSKLAKIPRSNAYEALEKLLSKGMVVSIPGNVKRYAASEPVLLKDKALVEFKRSIENDLQELENERQKILNRELNAVAQLDTTISELNTVYEASRNNNEPLEFIEVVKDGRQIDNMFIKLFRESKREALTLTKQRFYHMDEEKLGMVKNQIKSVTEVIRKGLSVRCIYELKPDEKENEFMCKNVIDKFVAAGEQVRLMKDIPMRMAIFDEETVMYTLVDAEGHCALNGYYTQVVRNKMMAKSLKMLFETLWGKAEDYDEYSKRMKY